MDKLVSVLPAALAPTPAIIDRTTIERWQRHTDPRFLQMRRQLQILDREITSYNDHIDNPTDGYRKLALAYKAARAAFKKYPGKEAAETALHHLSSATEKYAQIQLALENIKGVCAGYSLELATAGAANCGPNHRAGGTPRREVDPLRRFLKRQSATVAVAVKTLQQAQQVARRWYEAASGSQEFAAPCPEMTRSTEDYAQG